MANKWRSVVALVFAMAAIHPDAVASARAREDQGTVCRPVTIRQYPRADEHVRSSQPDVVMLIRDGLTRSPSFGELMTMLDGSDVVAYVELAPNLPTGLAGYLPHWVLVAGGRRYVRIFVDVALEHDRLIELIAHELKHATEVANAPDVKSNEAMRQLFHRLNSGKCLRGCAETDGAIDIQKTVAGELRAHRRLRPSTEDRCGVTRSLDGQLWRRWPRPGGLLPVTPTASFQIARVPSRQPLHTSPPLSR
jgi:hypothetical protein